MTARRATALLAVARRLLCGQENKNGEDFIEALADAGPLAAAFHFPQATAAGRW